VQAEDRTAHIRSEPVGREQTATASSTEIASTACALQTTAANSVLPKATSASWAASAFGAIAKPATDYGADYTTTCNTRGSGQEGFTGPCY
jgi:hypothetical protein